LPVAEASQYRIYSADTPDGPGTFVASTSDYTYTLPVNDDLKFYWVKAER
jgi:hypothetical protein